MLKIEEYISMRKRKEKINEFDFTKHSDNMGKIIQFVSEYFNDYLNPEDYNYELIKLQQTIEKSKKTLINQYPNTHGFIEEYYLNKKKRIDTFIKKVCDAQKDIDIFYKENEFLEIAKEVSHRLSDCELSDDDFSKVVLAVKDYWKYNISKPNRSEMKGLDNNIVKWVMDSYREFGVNIASYAFNIAWKWSDKYVEHKYSRQYDEHYYINSYDYRYQDNPFDIEEEYEKHQDKPFMQGKRDYFEMLVMYSWLFDVLEDTSYWPEYEKLCVKTRNVDLKTQRRVLVPISNGSQKYPEEIQSGIEYIESKNGLIKNKQKDQYIISILNEKTTDNIWTNNSVKAQVVNNIKKTVEKYGKPKLIEFRSPLKSPVFGMKELIDKYLEIEKDLKTLGKISIAIKTNSIRTSKEPVVHDMDDIMELHHVVEKMKLKLKIIIDLVDTNNRNVLKKGMEDLINSLASKPKSFIGFHINKIDEWGKIYGFTERGYKIDRNSYPSFSDFMLGLSTILQGTTPKLLIPEKVKSEEDLEKLVDTLYKCGCEFESGVNND
ncbi:hypothetical protein [Oceanobacillus alkalisoli]|uniref:hypothetical protein n=1 Tax=Oceanobacillus alkalisoli TaxID=2925113 RepID=UPI001F1210D4|nr:hypothetical protein [Oceanobacillus alkalisoli]MCF3943073.1 hypothetical protein [Oceanobacillus alkalisoli]